MQVINDLVKELKAVNAELAAALSELATARAELADINRLLVESHRREALALARRWQPMGPRPAVCMPLEIPCAHIGRLGLIAVLVPGGAR